MMLGAGPRLIVGAIVGKLIVGGAEGRPIDGRPPWWGVTPAVLSGVRDTCAGKALLGVPNC